MWPKHIIICFWIVYWFVRLHSRWCKSLTVKSLSELFSQMSVQFTLRQLNRPSSEKNMAHLFGQDVVNCFCGNCRWYDDIWVSMSTVTVSPCNWFYASFTVVPEALRFSVFPCVHRCVHLSVCVVSTISMVCIDRFSPNSLAIHLGTRMIIRFWGQKIKDKGHSLTKYGKNTLGGGMHSWRCTSSTNSLVLLRIWFIKQKSIIFNNYH